VYSIMRVRQRVARVHLRQLMLVLTVNSRLSPVLDVKRTADTLQYRAHIFLQSSIVRITHWAIIPDA